MAANFVSNNIAAGILGASRNARLASAVTDMSGRNSALDVNATQAAHRAFVNASMLGLGSSTASEIAAWAIVKHNLFVQGEKQKAPQRAMQRARTARSVMAAQSRAFYDRG